ncbi:hypothetical protein IQ07DRAFT_643470 [Pyrenochaeta sp. DS3sAY3a]|nr:hypothetical protein IQ07DRAFT_643470 [Pyrenochaeta sp. DS3sAY3a]
MSSAEETPVKDAIAQESVAEAQVDGSAPPSNGAALAETEFNVEVKLADLQADPNNPQGFPVDKPSDPWHAREARS